MDEQTQAQFVEWLAANLGATTEEELNSAIEQMGEEGLQQAFAQFQQEQATQTLRNGGRVDYFKKLQSFRKGGKSCKGKMKDGKAKSKTALGVTKWNKKKDAATALGRREDASKKETTARAHKQGGKLQELASRLQK